MAVISGFPGCTRHVRVRDTPCGRRYVRGRASSCPTWAYRSVSRDRLAATLRGAARGAGGGLCRSRAGWVCRAGCRAAGRPQLGRWGSGCRCGWVCRSPGRAGVVAHQNPVRGRGASWVVAAVVEQGSRTGFATGLSGPPVSSSSASTARSLAIIRAVRIIRLSATVCSVHSFFPRPGGLPGGYFELGWLAQLSILIWPRARTFHIRLL